MKLDPFIEAEKIAGHSVAKTCGLFEVSRAAHYQRRNGAPSARQVGDAELTKQIVAIQPSPRARMDHPGSTRSSATAKWACGKRRVTRLMRLAGLEGRCKKRWRKTTIADPEAEEAWISSSASSGRARRSTVATWATSPTSPPGRGGPTCPPSSTWLAARWSAGLWPTTCAPSWSRTP